MIRSLSVLMQLIVLASAWSIAGAAAAQTPHTHHHGFGDTQQWIKIFDDPQRDAWQKPHEVINALALRADAVVADLGAGTGYFAMRLGHMVPAGRIYAVDTEPAMVRHLAERASKSGLKNVVALQATADDARLPEKLDLILLVDVYHHIDNPGSYFERLRSTLRPGGRVAIIDFKRDSPIGPPANARVSSEAIGKQMAQAGYVLTRSHDFLPHQYFLQFEVDPKAAPTRR